MRKQHEIPVLRAKAAWLMVLAFADAGCGAEPLTQKHVEALDPYCSVKIIHGDGSAGWVDVENDYLPHVVMCEHGGAPYEALKAQAVAARSYLYYELAKNGAI